MTDQPGTVDGLAQEFGVVLASLEGVLTPANAPQLFAELGVDSPPDLAADEGFSQKLANAGGLAAALTVDIDAAADSGGDSFALAQALSRLLDSIARFIAALREVAVDLQRATAGLTDATELAQFALTFVERLLGAAFVDYLEAKHPFLRRVFSLLTLIEVQSVTVQVAQNPVTVTRRRFYPERINELFGDPLSLFEQIYGWGSVAFDGKLVFANTRDVFDALFPIAVYREPDQDGPAGLDLFGVLIRAASDITSPGIQGSLFADVPNSFDLTLGQLSDNVRCALQVQGAFPAGMRLLLIPPVTIEVPGEEGAAGTVALNVIGESSDPASPFTVFGESGGTALQARRISAGIVANLIWDAGTASAKADIGFEAEFTEGLLTIDPSASDGFLTSVLPAGGLRAPFSFGLLWSNQRGLTFRDAASLDATFALGLSVAGLAVPTIHLSLQAGNAGLQAEVSASVGISIGPVEALMDRVGMTVDVTFPQDGGNLGVADLLLAFKSPSGIGLAVDAGVLTGGGLLGYDPGSGRYSGVLELRAEQVGITAMGLLDTRLPAGGSGYSLLLVLQASFPAIEVGFGFALTGVGGLLALNRSVDVDVLRARLAAGTAGRFLAPADPIRNAPTLLADLDAVFPVTAGVTVVGPTVQLIWAGLVHFDVGVFIELPGPTRVVLLGSAYAQIIDGGRTYLSVRVDIVGVVDLRGQTAAFDAVLVNSHLMGMLDLTGGAAFRLSWGAQPYAVLTLGGFNPSYNPAPLSFPATLTPIAMVHGKPTDEVYLRFEGYFAITSNTLQFGASVEAVLQSGGFVIHGALGFDALIQRVPFHFEFDIRASVHVAYGSHSLGGLTLTGSLTGPGPVVLRAKVCIELLFFDICFSHTFELGPSTPPPTPSAPDLLDSLVTELADPTRLRGAGAPDPLVRLHPPDPTLSAPVISPTGTLVWEQQRAPLELLLTRVGGTPLPAPVQVGATSTAPPVPQSDWFAPGLFLDLTDDQALNQPGYELLTSGLQLSGAGTADGPSAQTTVSTQQIRLPATTGPVKPASVFPLWLLTPTVARTAAPTITVGSETWTLSTPAGQRTNLTGAQARQLATYTPTAHAIPTTDHLPAMSI